jgi:ATP synthase protein I
MGEHSESTNERERAAFSREIGEQAARKLKARRDSAHGVWFGLGMMGIIGWSVVVPTILGTALGIWLDRRHPGTQSWTLMLLVIGLVVGCVTAWQWVAKEDDAMREERENNHE